MGVDYEKTSQHLSGEFIPRDIRKRLPRQYAHFNSLGSFVSNIENIRDQAHFNTAYQTAWIGLCMMLDQPFQAHLMESLKNNLLIVPPRVHRSEIGKYWEDLDLGSSFPIYYRESRDLLHSGYGKKAVQSWTAENYLQKHESLIQPVELASRIYPFVFDPGLHQEVWGWKYHRAQNVETLHKEVLSHGGEELLGYVTSLQLLVGSRRITLGGVVESIKQLEESRQGRLRFEIPDREKKIKYLLKKAEPYRVFANGILPKITDREKDLFGQDSEMAGILWRTVSHLRYGNLPSSVHNVDIRLPLLNFLLDGKFNDARLYVVDLMARYPGVIPQFVAQELDLDPASLRNLYVSVLEAAKQAKGPETKAQKAVREKQEAIAKIAPVMNIELVSSDGKFSLSVGKYTTNGQDIKPYDTYYIKSPNLSEIVGKKIKGEYKIFPMKPQSIAELIKRHGFVPNTNISA